MSETTVTLSGVTKRYGAQLGVEAVDLILRAGERIALVGHNGAGKSTLIKLMLGLIRPTQGRVQVLGEDPAHGAAIRAKMQIGYLPENLVLHPSMTGFELMDFYARLKRQPVAREPRDFGARRHRRGGGPPHRNLFQRDASAYRPGPGLDRQAATLAVGRTDQWPRSGPAAKFLRNRRRTGVRRRDGSDFLSCAGRAGKPVGSRRGHESRAQGRGRDDFRTASPGRTPGAHPA